MLGVIIAASLATSAGIRNADGEDAKFPGQYAAENYAAIRSAPTCSSSPRNSACGAIHIVRYVSMKGDEGQQIDLQIEMMGGRCRPRSCCGRVGVPNSPT